MSDPVYLLIIKNDLRETIGRSSVAIKSFSSGPNALVGEPRPPPFLEQSLLKRGRDPIPPNPLAKPALLAFDYIDSAILANIDAHLAVTTTINTGPKVQKAAQISYLEVSPLTAPVGQSGLAQYFRLRFEEVVAVTADMLAQKPKTRVDLVYNARPTADEIYRAFRTALLHADNFITAVTDIDAEVQANTLFAISQAFEEVYVFAPIVIAQGGSFFYLVARRPKTKARGYRSDLILPFLEAGSMYYTLDQRAAFYLYLEENTQDIYLTSDYLTDYDYWKLPSLFAIPSHPLKQPVLRLLGGCESDRGQRGGAVRGRGRGAVRGRESARGRGRGAIRGEESTRGRGRGREESARGRGESNRGRARGRGEQRTSPSRRGFNPQQRGGAFRGRGDSYQRTFRE